MRFLLFIFMFVSSVTYGRSYNVLYPLSEDEVPSASSIASAKEEGLRMLSQTPKAAKEERLRDAAYGGDVEEVKKLLKEGVDPNAVDIDGRTALHLAFEIEVIKVLLASKKIDVNARDSRGTTALQEAAEKNDLTRVKLLLDAGAKPHLAGIAKYTPLHETTNVKVAEALLAKGARLDAQANLNQTPLHRSVILGNIELTRLYLEKGADLNAKTTDGETPFDYADNKEIKEMLSAAAKASCKGTFNN